MSREDIRLQIRQIRDLPTLPAVVTRVLEAADSHDTTARMLGDIVSQDVAVSAKVLSLANSAFYGFSRRITTIPQAVVVLGFDTVRSLALSVSVFDTLSSENGRVSFDRESFWIHSIACGTAARMLAKSLKLEDPETYFVAGLFHDLGKIILDTFFHDAYQDVVATVQTATRPVYEIEQDILDIDHAEVGGMIAERWKFPKLLVTPIASHHDLLKVGEEQRLVTLVVHLANFLIKRAELGLALENIAPETSTMVRSHLDVNPQMLRDLITQLTEERDRIVGFLGCLAA